MLSNIRSLFSVRGCAMYILVVLLCSCNRGGNAGPPKHLTTVSCGMPNNPSAQCIECEYRGGKFCGITVGWLKQLPHNADHYPILIHAKDQVLWIGDDGEDIKIDKAKMTGVKCDNENTPDRNAPTEPITDPVDVGYGNSHKMKLASARVDNIGYCYKHSLHWDKGLFRSGDIDPHVYIGDALSAD
jgi:hypothetical protein